MAEMEQESTEQTQAPKRKLPVKTAAIIAVIMILEGVGVVGFLMMTSRKPADAIAGIEGLEEADREATLEILLVKDRFQNMSTNRLWRWDAMVYMKVRRKNEKHVNEVMEARSAEIQAGVTKIFRRAQHSHLKEPDLKTLTRQLTAYCNEIFGEDPDGLPRVDRVMITSLNGLPTDG